MKLYLAGLLTLALAAGGYYYSKNHTLTAQAAQTVEVEGISTAVQLDVAGATGQLVLVKFYADWCGPCKAYAPVYEEVANEYAGKIKFVKINVDTAEKELTRNIESIPTTILCRGKYAVGTSGGMDKEGLKDFITKATAKLDELEKANGK